MQVGLLPVCYTSVWRPGYDDKLPPFLCSHGQHMRDEMRTRTQHKEQLMQEVVDAYLKNTRYPERYFGSFLVGSWNYGASKREYW